MVITRRTVLSIFVFIAIFLSSILGASLFGVSLNKIALIPLMVYLLLFLILKRKKLFISRNTVIIIIFFLLAAASSLLSLLSDYTYIEGYTSRSLLFFVQSILIYVPLIILLDSYTRYGSNRKYLLYAVKKSIVITFRIHAVFALLEFVMFFIAGIEFPTAILSVFYGSDAAPALINLGSLGIFLRPTGLNMDPAYFGIAMVFGFMFEKNRLWKFIGFLCVCLAMSRVAILTIVVVFLLQLRYKKIKARTIIIFAILAVAFIAVALSNPYINSQITGLFSRLTLSSNNGDSGTMRHILYFPKSIEVWFSDYSLLQKLIGYGPRQSGTILAHSGVMDEYLIESMFVTSWSAECDFAELLLGYGLVGIILYAAIVLRLLRLRKGIEIVAVVALFGLMYDISSSTYVLFILIALTCVLKKAPYRQKKPAVKGGLTCSA